MATPPRAASFPLLAAALLAAGVALAVPTRPSREETVKDRKSFIPERKLQALGGKVVGIVVGDPQPILSTEGRSGPPDSLCFSSGGASYRWVYVPAADSAIITNLQV